MKNRKGFIIGVCLYIIGYLYFCIYGGFNYGLKVSDNPLLKNRVLFSSMPVGVINLSMSMFLWIIISFFLILFIIWQTNLKGVRLNRTALICYAIHMIITCLSRGIVELLSGKNGISISLFIIIIVFVLVVVSFIITYFVQKKNGMLNNYLGYSDITWGIQI